MSLPRFSMKDHGLSLQGPLSITHSSGHQLPGRKEARQPGGEPCEMSWKKKVGGQVARCTQDPGGVSGGGLWGR